MKRRMLRVLAVLMIMVTFISGCGGSAGTKETEASKGTEAVKETAAAGATTAKAEDGTENAGAVSDAQWPEYAQFRPVDQLPEKTLKFAFLGYNNNPFWNLVHEGYDDAVELFSGLNVEIEDVNMGNEITAKAYNDAIDACILKGYDGIVGVPLLSGTEVGINRAAEAGIPVVNIVGEAEESDTPMNKLTCIMTNSEKCAEIHAKAFVDYLKAENNGEPAKYGYIQSYLGSKEDLQRKHFVDYLENMMPGCEMIGPFEALDQAEKVYAAAKDMINANPDLKAIIISGGGPNGAARAVQELGKTGEIYVFANDEIPENLQYVKSGEMWEVMSQGPQGQVVDAFTVLYNYVVAGEEPQSKLIDSKIFTITKDNVDEYLK